MLNELVFSNGLSIFLILDGDQFLGLGSVRYNGVELRAPVLPWCFYTEAEAQDFAVRFETFRLEGVEKFEGGFAVKLKSQGLFMPRAQEADAMGEARIKSRRVAPPEVSFTWVFKPVTEKLFEHTWDGVEMRIDFTCPDAPIHWVLEQATWEIGGEATNNTLIQQDLSTIDLEKQVLAGDSFSTIEKFFTDGWGGSYPMDMLPRAAGAGICDFMAKGDTALCLFSERPGLTRARFEKHANEDVIHFLDRAYFPLAEAGSAQSRKLLVHRSDAQLEKHDIRNLWLDCFMDVRQRIHQAYDFKLEVPTPCIGAHLWDADLKERMDKWHEPIQEALPEYHRLGYQTVFTHGVWNSITSDEREWMKGNICCPYSFEFADSFGGKEGMRTLNDVAQSCQVDIAQWFSFHLSKEAPIWKEHPDWILKEANGDPWDGKYGSLWSGRMRSDYRKWFQDQLFQVQEDTGINAIFWDSYQNLGVTCIDWGADDKAPQAEEIFLMQSELQKRGFKQRVEVVTIFGVSAVAMFGFKNDAFRRRLWDDCWKGDHAFALLDTSAGFFVDGALAHPDRLSVEVYFWLAAHRAIPSLGADPWELEGSNKTRLPGGDRAEDYARVNHLYNALLPYMHRPRVQTGGKYIVWLDSDGAPAIAWSFDNIIIPKLDFAQDIESGTVVNDGSLKAGRTYGLNPQIDWASLVSTHCAGT